LFLFFISSAWKVEAAQGSLLSAYSTGRPVLFQSPSEYFESLCGETSGSCTWIAIKITRKIKKKKNTLKSFWGPMP